MKTINDLFNLIFCVLCFSTILSPVYGQNLIANPGCEDTLVSGEIPYWTEILGSNWTQRSSNPFPFEGGAYFFPGVASVAELQQEVDVSNYSSFIDAGVQQFIFEGYVRSYNQSPADETQIILEYLDSAKSVKLDSIDLGKHSNTSDWKLISDSTIAPTNTRYIRIRLISTRHAGSNNDGYYDALSLIPNLTTNINLEEDYVPKEFTLLQNYPNPFNPTTKIRWQSPISSHQTLKIYDLLGREVATLVNEFKPAGSYEINFDASNLSSGVYYYQLRAGDFIEIKKMIYLK